MSIHAPNSLSSHVSTQCFTSDEVTKLAREALRLQDVLLLKVLCVLSQHQDPQHQAKFVPVVQDLAGLAQVGQF